MSDRVVQEAIDGLTWRINLWQTFVDEYRERRATESVSELTHWYEGKQAAFEIAVESLKALISRIKEVEQEEKVEKYKEEIKHEDTS